MLPLERLYVTVGVKPRVRRPMLSHERIGEHLRDVPKRAADVKLRPVAALSIRYGHLGTLVCGRRRDGDDGSRRCDVLNSRHYGPRSPRGSSPLGAVPGPRSASSCPMRVAASMQLDSAPMAPSGNGRTAPIAWKARAAGSSIFAGVELDVWACGRVFVGGCARRGWWCAIGGRARVGVGVAAIASRGFRPRFLWRAMGARCVRRLARLLRRVRGERRARWRCVKAALRCRRVQVCARRPRRGWRRPRRALSERVPVIATSRRRCAPIGPR